MAPAEKHRLDAILERLAPAERAWLSERLEPAYMARQRRLAERDGLVLAAVASAPGTTVTARAAALERRLARATASRGDAIADRIIALSGNRTLSWQHILRIERESRSGTMCKNSAGDAHGDAGENAHEPDEPRVGASPQADFRTVPNGGDKPSEGGAGDRPCNIG